MRIKLNNADYYAYTAGHAPRGDRDTVVFVHGAAMEHSVWSHQSRYFAYHGDNIAAVDLPGHHLSGGELLTDIESMARWLRELISRIDGRAIHLVGHSMGALIALQAAAELASPASPSPSPSPAANHTVAPLKSLTLIGFCYPMTVTPALLEAARDDPPAAYSMMTQWSFASATGGEPVPGFWSPGLQFSMMTNSAPGAIYADLTACNNYAAGADAFARLGDCPVLFLCGQRDRMAPAKLAQKHADANARARIVLLPDCGHSLLSEAPHAVLRELKTFIDRHRGA